MTYLSEVMLQQTTVMTVENKLKSYLKEFPDFRSYKNKDLSDVLNSWSGLGYYKRAENLFRSVEIINEKYDGKLPSDVFQLLNLPGIGSYTANAVLAIAYNKKAFPVDVNIRRLLLRLTGQSFNDNELNNLTRNIEVKIFVKSDNNFSEKTMHGIIIDIILLKRTTEKGTHLKNKDEPIIVNMIKMVKGNDTI